MQRNKSGASRIARLALGHLLLALPHEVFRLLIRILGVSGDCEDCGEYGAREGAWQRQCTPLHLVGGHGNPP